MTGEVELSFLKIANVRLARWLGVEPPALLAEIIQGGLACSDRALRDGLSLVLSRAAKPAKSGATKPATKPRR